MKIEPTALSPIQLEADAVVMGVYEDTALPAATAVVDEALGGAISRLRENDEVSAKRYELTSLLAPQGIAAGQVLIVGLGSSAKIDRGTAFRAAATAARKLSSKKDRRIGVFLDDSWPTELTEDSIAGTIVGTLGQDLHRGERKQHAFTQVWIPQSKADCLKVGRILGEAVNLTRRLVNEPASVIYPESFAEQARKTAEATGLEIEVWDEAKLRQQRCGSLMGVAQGSDRPPQLVILRHRGGSDGKPALALVGKGVTFDSGGLSLKTGEHMNNMKMDMAGAATVLGAMQAIAQLKLPVNVVGLMGMVENLPSGKSYKLGDVLTARNGKTIEVLNTDAEGRLVLADVLSVAVDEGAERIVDLATLTGACIVALGANVAGLMTNDSAWCDTVAKAAEDCGDPAWQLPMFEEYGEQIKSDVADIKNIGDGRWGRRDHGGEVPRRVRRRPPVDAHRHRRAGFFGKEQAVDRRRRQRLLRADAGRDRAAIGGVNRRPASASFQHGDAERAYRRWRGYHTPDAGACAAILPTRSFATDDRSDQAAFPFSLPSSACPASSAWPGHCRRPNRVTPERQTTAPATQPRSNSPGRFQSKRGSTWWSPAADRPVRRRLSAQPGSARKSSCWKPPGASAAWAPRAWSPRSIPWPTASGCWSAD